MHEREERKWRKKYNDSYKEKGRENRMDKNEKENDWRKTKIVKHNNRVRKKNEKEDNQGRKRMEWSTLRLQPMASQCISDSRYFEAGPNPLNLSSRRRLFFCSPRSL